MTNNNQKVASSITNYTNDVLTNFKITGIALFFRRVRNTAKSYC